MKNLTLIVTLSILLGNLAYAQEQPVVEMFKEYISEVNNLNDSRKMRKVRQFFADDAKIQDTEVSPDGKTTSSTSDVKSYMAGLEGLISSNSFNPNIVIEQFSNVQQSENKGTLTVFVTMNLTLNGKIIDKSTYLVNLIAVKENKNWKITFLSNVRNVEERIAGDCICYLYERADRIATEVIYPSGIQYSKKLDVFVIGDLDKSKIIGNDGQQYEWKPGSSLKNIYSIDFRSSIGVAKTIQEAIILILGQKYSNECLKFILK